MIPIKQTPINLILLSAVLTLSLFLVSCGGDGNGDGPPTGNGTDVEVIDFTPDSAYAGEVVQVQGLGFSGNAGDNQIWFNETEATTDSVTLTEGSDSGTLYTILPEGASDGPIAVDVGGDRAESGSDFNVIESVQQEEDDAYARVYWSALKEFSNGGGQRGIIGTSYINEQGRKINEVLYELFDFEGSSDRVPATFGLALDLNSEMMYWIDNGESTGDPVIARSGFAGDTSSVDTLYTSADGLGLPHYVVLDLNEQALYWADLNNGIMKGSLDGSAAAQIVYSAGEAGIDAAVGIDMKLDAESDMLYWTEALSNEIVAAPKDGSGSPTVLFGPDDASPSLGSSGFMTDLAVDTEENYLYVAEGEDGRVLRGNLDGSGSLETVLAAGNGLGFFGPLALDRERKYMYWGAMASGYEGLIVRSKMNGDGQPERVYDLREIQAQFGVQTIYGLAVVPGQGSAKAKGTGYIPPVYLKF